MAREIAVMFSAIFDDDESTVEFGMPKTFFDVTGANYIKHKQNVGATEEALVLGDVTVGGWLVARNNHATAVISIRQATSAADFADLGPGEGCVIPISTDMTAPFVISTVAGAELEYLLVDA